MSAPTEKPKVMLKCRECGGTNVQHAMWVRVNTDEVLDAFGSWNFDGSSFCEDCEDHHPLD